ncbi:MAG: hypothetical protein M3Y91_19540 [Actinomycetota bacterium]|nr:hypothetical protein [Actinomycetota bacterium]
MSTARWSTSHSRRIPGDAWSGIRDDPSRLGRRHFEACVFAYLAEELRAGDVAVVGIAGVRQLDRPADPLG